MRKDAFPRFIRFLLIYGAVFVLLVAMQFPRRGNFSQRVGDIQVNGRYLLDASERSSNPRLADPRPSDRRLLDGDAGVLFGGLEFRLASSGSKKADQGGGFSLIDLEGNSRQVLPEYVIFPENPAQPEVVFVLPGGTELSFIIPGGATGGVRISAKFADDVSGVVIPFKPQRSSVIQLNGDNGLNISYNGNRYGFNRPLDGLESGWLFLSAAVPSVSYHILSDKKEINPEDFFIPGTETPEVFASAVSQWTNGSFVRWRQNMSGRVDEDTVIAWCAEALRRGGYGSAASVVPAAFSTDPGRTWESAVYQFDRRIGTWERAVAASVVIEREKTNRISRMLEEKDTAVFAESNLIGYLAVRGSDRLVDGVLSLAAGLDPSGVTFEMLPGIFEGWVQTAALRPGAENPFDTLAERACMMAAEGLRADGGAEGDDGGGAAGGERVFAFSGDTADLEFNLRLGKALEDWAEKTGKEDWARVGRSLALSVILSVSDTAAPATASAAGAVPESMTIGPDGGFIPSPERIGSAKLYRLLNRGEYTPRAVATGVNGIWAWTAAESVSVTRNEREMVISTVFPAGGTHYIMLTNVPPFPILQINGSNWRRAADFESYYDAPGWYYFERDRVLILKLRHRTATEQVRILFVAPPAPPPPPPAPPPPPPPQETED